MSAIRPVDPRPRGGRRVLETAARIDSGFWRARQAINARESLDAGWIWVNRSGALPNFERVASGAVGGFLGEVNQDAEAYKWTEAASYEFARTGDVELGERLETAVRAIAAAPAPDGYMHMWHQLTPDVPRFSGLRNGGPDETYTTGHLLHAAVAHHRATGDRRLIEIGLRAASALKTQLFDVETDMVTGHAGLEMGLVELYRETRETWLLDLARDLIDRRGHGVLGTHRFGSSHYQDDVPIRELPVLTGHAVAGLYLMCGATDVAVETEDDGLLSALERIWESTTERRMYITGGLGSRPKAEDIGDDFEMSPDSAYCETCAAAGLVMWSWRLLLATGDARYGDLIERTLYNGLLVGVALDGRRFRYDNPLQVRSGYRTPAERRSAERSEWFELACCPPNLMRLVASLGHYVGYDEGDDLTLQQLVGAVIPWGDGAIEMESELPGGGDVALRYRGPDREGTVRMRVPAWSDGATIGGEPVACDRGFLLLSRRWTDGDEVRIGLAVESRLTVAHPRVDAVRGQAAVERGPLVYAAEEIDNDFDLDDALIPDGFSPHPVTDAALGIDAIGVDAIEGEIAIVSDEQRPLYRALADAPSDSPRPATLRLVPYFAWGNRRVGAMRTWLRRVGGQG